MALVLLGDAERDLFDTFGRGVARGDLDAHRVAQHARRELTDVVRVGGREHQVLALRRQHLEDALDRMDEAHVEHAVGLVEHEMLDVREIRRALLHEVDEAARRRDQQVAALAQPVHLRTLADAAEDDERAQVGVTAVGAGAVGDLRRELARRAQHQHARRAALRGAEQLQQRQHEARRLAGAGLRAGEDIAAREHRRDGLGLDGGRRVVALVGDGAQQPGLEPEIGELHGDTFGGPSARWRSRRGRSRCGQRQAHERGR